MIGMLKVGRKTVDGNQLRQTQRTTEERFELIAVRRVKNLLSFDARFDADAKSTVLINYRSPL